MTGGSYSNIIEIDMAFVIKIVLPVLFGSFSLLIRLQAVLEGNNMHYFVLALAKNALANGKRSVLKKYIIHYYFPAVAVIP
uniref:Uncharacterized protein n=1 Tax=Rhizophora mucronata TaxID=61149 RepID=A0A2P2JTK1_RHIMU